MNSKKQIPCWDEIETYSRKKEKEVCPLVEYIKNPDGYERYCNHSVYRRDIGPTSFDYDDCESHRYARIKRVMDTYEQASKENHIKPELYDNEGTLQCCWKRFPPKNLVDIIDAAWSSEVEYMIEHYVEGYIDCHSIDSHNIDYKSIANRLLNGEVISIYVGELSTEDIHDLKMLYLINCQKYIQDALIGQKVINNELKIWVSRKDRI